MSSPRTFCKIGLLPAVLPVLLTGCITVDVFKTSRDPLLESRISGKADRKVLVIHVDGIISDQREEGTWVSQPSMVEEIVAMLDKAEGDSDVKAVVLLINSPGGTVTASEILYDRLIEFKKKTNAKVVANLMDVAASGGYYVALAADHIIAHPSTVTGSVGVIYMRPEVTGLLDKIGVEVLSSKSGRYKDIGSPFRKPTAEEDKIIQGIVDQIAARFVQTVSSQRKIEAGALENVSTARIYVAAEALELKLVDEIGFTDAAVSKAKQLAGLPKDAQVIAYRRSKYPNDNIYNTMTNRYGSPGLPVSGPQLPLGVLGEVLRRPAGFYYLWLPGMAGED